MRAIGSGLGALALLSSTVLLVGLGACGSHGSTLNCTDASTFGLDPTTLLVNLTAMQKEQLCDWAACQVGGYGAPTPSCGSGNTVTIDSSQQQCVSQLPTATSCTATVADSIACTQALAANECSAFASSACDPIVQCDIEMKLGPLIDGG